ncbi:MAG: hypothetical protein U0792_05375 [Gemmataceae bacterium]
MPIACFDLTGTLVHHQTWQPIPLMPKLLRSLRERKWELKIVTSWGQEQASLRLVPIFAKSGLSPADVEVISGSHKRDCVLRFLERAPEDVIFVDDKPEHLEAVHTLRHPRLRIFGFLGSRKYAPEAGYTACRLGLPYAFTAIDLGERLNASAVSDVGDVAGLSLADLISLIPGLNHPWSALAGETAWNDHRRIPTTISQRRAELNSDQRDQIWSSLAWVRCEECTWKWMAELAALECNHELSGNPYQADEYTAALVSAAPEVLRALINRLQRGFALMWSGVNSIGRGASKAPLIQGGERIHWVAQNLHALEVRLSIVESRAG